MDDAGIAAVSAGVVLAVAFGAGMEMALTLLALAAGLMLLREGCALWPAVDRVMGCGVALLFIGLPLWLGFLIWAGHWAWLPDPGWDTATRAQLFAGPCAVLGLVGIAYKWWWLDEGTLNEMMHLAGKLTVPSPRG